jgi:hypothetical protein
MEAFLYGKGQILWDVTVDTGYVQSMNFLAPGSRDMFDANNKVADYLFRALCQPEFDRVHTEHLACRIWSVLKEAHVGNAQVQARMYATYRREYENFTHLPGESLTTPPVMTPQIPKETLLLYISATTNVVSMVLVVEREEGQTYPFQ